MASEFLNGAYTVTIGNRDELKGNQDITQQVMTCTMSNKNGILMDILRKAGVADKNNGNAKGLVFCSTKKMCDQLCQQLERSGVPCSAVHGDKDQRSREAALGALKEGRIKLLVATDVAARGLDIKGVTLVVNFDAPSNTEDYVHRIGRTGRAGQKGFAVTLIVERDAHALRGIVEVMKRTNQEVSPEIEQMARNAPPPPPPIRRGKRGGDDSGPMSRGGSFGGGGSFTAGVSSGGSFAVSSGGGGAGGYSGGGGGSGGGAGGGGGSYGGGGYGGGGYKGGGGRGGGGRGGDSGGGDSRALVGRGRGGDRDRSRSRRRSPSRRRSNSRRRNRSPSRRRSRSRRRRRSSSSSSS